MRRGYVSPLSEADEYIIATLDRPVAEVVAALGWTDAQVLNRRVWLRKHGFAPPPVRPVADAFDARWRGKLFSNERPSVLTDFEWQIIQTLLRMERTSASAIAKELGISTASVQQALRLIDRALSDAEAGRINPSRTPKVPKPAPPLRGPRRFARRWAGQLPNQRPITISETAWAVATYTVAHPDATTREIAQAVGVCHQRVSQILVNLDGKLLTHGLGLRTTADCAVRRKAS